MRSSSFWVWVLFSALAYLPAAAQEPSHLSGNTSRTGARAAAGTSEMSNAGPCTNPKLARYRASPNSTGDTVEGGVCVQVSPVNRLRNFIYISTTITQTAGPSPASIFPASGQQPVSGGGAITLRDLDGALRGVEVALRARQDHNRAAAANMDEILARLKEFITHSDESVLGGDFAGLVNDIKARKSQIDQALGGGARWQAADDLLKTIHTLQNNLVRVPSQSPQLFTEPATKAENQKMFNDLTSQMGDLENKALAQASGSDQAKAIGVKIGLLQYWSGVLGSFLNPDGSVPQDPASKFVVHQDVPCPTLFNLNRETAVKLTVGDRLPFFDGQQMSTQTRDAFVTVKCTSPFSLSAGVAFSLVEQREFAIQPSPVSPGSTTVVNRFGYSSRSTVNPVPLAMAHMRLYEWQNHRYALHASFGVGANVQGTNGGGSSAEYLPAVSLSLFRTMYLSTGVAITKQASLAGGFAVKDEVPSSVTSPPIQTSYKVGAGFAITFTKP